MRTINIYDKDFEPLTTLTSAEFTSLSYKRAHMEIGECEFTVRLDRDKITSTNLEHYNRVEVLDNGVVKFIGVIVRKSVNIDTAQIRCRELTYVLKKRIMGASYVVNGDIDTEVTGLLSDVNSDDDTGIALGDVSEAVGNVNTTFNRANAFEILQQITKSTGNQFRLENDRTLGVKPSIGTDLSDTILFIYDVGIVSGANILKFDVEDDGDEIVTKVYGKSGGNTSTQEDVTLKGKYGVLEKYRDFRVVNTSGVLDEFSEAEIKDRIFSPNIELNPEVADTFDVGDTVRVVLKNSLIDIDSSFQVLEKRVQYNGDQSRITVRINDLPSDLAEKLSERERRLELLEKEL